MRRHTSIRQYQWPAFHADLFQAMVRDLIGTRSIEESVQLRALDPECITIRFHLEVGERTEYGTTSSPLFSLTRYAALDELTRK